MATDAGVLLVRIEAQMRQFERAMAKASGAANTTAGRIEKRFRGMERSLAGVGAGLGRSLLGPLTAALGGAALFRNFTQNTIEQQKVLAQLEAVLKSTGKAAGVTSAEVQALGSSLQKMTAFDDEAIIGAENLLLTFTKIGKDVFPQAITAVLDMSTALGKDLSSTATQVGKALQDPIKGITALRKVGVDFDDGQKAVIKSLVESGDLAKAQAIILRELEKEYGDSAKAARDTLGGALQALGNAWSDLFELQGPAAEGLRQSIEDLITTITDPKFQSGVADLGAVLFGVLDGVARAAQEAADAIKEFKALFPKSAAELGDGKQWGQDSFTDVQLAAQTAADAVKEFFNPTGVEALRQEITDTEEALKSASDAAEQGFQVTSIPLLQSQLAALRAELAALTDHTWIVNVAMHRASEDASMKALEEFRKRPSGTAPPPLLEGDDDGGGDLGGGKSGRRAAISDIERQEKAVEQLISDLEFERRLIGLTNEQREIEIALRQAGAVATDAQKLQIEALVSAGIREQEALDSLIERMDELRDVAGGALNSFNQALQDGQGFAAGLKSALESVLDAVIRIAQQKLIESLFGAFGTAGGGGGIGAIIGGLLGAGGGGSSSLGGGAGPLKLGSLATVGGMKMGGGQAPAVVQLVVGPGQLFEPTVVGISGAVAVQTIKQNNKFIPAMIASQRARGLA